MRNDTNQAATDLVPTVAVASRWEPCEGFVADRAGSPVCACGWLADEHATAAAAA